MHNKTEAPHSAAVLLPLRSTLQSAVFVSGCELPARVTRSKLEAQIKPVCNLGAKDDVFRMTTEPAKSLFHHFESTSPGSRTGDRSRTRYHRTFHANKRHRPDWVLLGVVTESERHGPVKQIPCRGP